MSEELDLKARVDGAGPRLFRLTWLPWAGLLALSGAIALAAYHSPQSEGSRIALVLGTTILIGSLLKLGFEALIVTRRAIALRQMKRLFWGDVSACFALSAEGEILFANRAGRARLDGATTLTALLEELFAHPASVVQRLQHSAQSGRGAVEDVESQGGVLRLSVHMPVSGLYLWRLEEAVDRGLQSRGPDGLSLPMLVATESGAVLYSNDALRRILGTRPRRLDRVILDHPVTSGAEVTIPGLEGLLRCTALEVLGAAGRREIYFLPLLSAPAAPTVDEMEDFPVAIMRLRDNGVIQMANREARAIFGLGAAGFGNLSDLVEGLGRPVRDWVADVAAGRMPGRPEILRLRSPTAEEAFVQISIRRLGARGSGGLLAVVSDATDIKTLEAQFVQSQKMQAIGQLAGGVAHDFNNLLTALSGHCDLLLLRHRPTDPDYADLSQIRQNANRAAALVRQLLAFSRKQTLKPEILQLPDIFSEVSHLLKRLVGETIKLEFHVDPDLPPIRADRRQLEQVLLNLVVNARDAMEGAGRIEVTAAPVVLATDLQKGRAVVPAGDYALIKVRDWGSGIAPEHLDKIFEPFFTTKRQGEGTGLGLPTAYGIVKQSGGFIFAQSELGYGTEFTIYFPFHDGIEQSEPVLSPPPKSARTTSGTVLLVEDEAPVRAFAARALRHSGLTVLEAEDAEAALDLLADREVAVDVFVTDVVMPGMDGPAWVNEALKDRPETRVIFMSGYAEETFADRQIEIAGSVFLPKPFSLEELTRTVQGQIQ